MQQRAGSLNIKRLFLIKGNQISQVKELSAFLCVGRGKGLGSLKSVLWCAPHLTGAQLLCVHIPSLLRARSGAWLKSDDCQAAGSSSFLPEFPQGSPAHHWWWLGSLMTVASLFTDMAGPSPFLIYETHTIPLGLIQRSWILPPTGQKPPQRPAAGSLPSSSPLARWLSRSGARLQPGWYWPLSPRQAPDRGPRAGRSLLISRQLLTAIKTNHETLSAVGSLVLSLKVVGLQSLFS